MALKGRQKVAAYLLSLNTQAAAEILTSFEDDEIRSITEEMLALKHLDGDTIEAVRKELKDVLASGKSLGVSDTGAAAEKLLEAALGAEKGHDILSNRTKVPTRIPFEALNNMEAGRICSLLNGEHPQTIAVVLSFLSAQLSANVLSDMPEDQHADIVARMTRMEASSQEVLRDIETLLYKKADAMEGATTTSAGTSRVKSVADILNIVGKNVRKNVLDHLGQADPESAEEIESLMFVFEDLLNVDDRSIQKIVSDVDKQTLALALKNAGEEIKDKILKNMSKRGAESMGEELEMLGPKPLSEVEEAQRAILDVARDLDERGEIALRPGEQEAMV